MDEEFIMKEDETFTCPVCTRILSFDDLTFNTSIQNINEDGEHSLVIEYKGNAGAELEKKYGEEFWENASNLEVAVALILGGECCEGDYIVIGSDFNELQVQLQAASVIVAEHHSENNLHPCDVMREVERLMKEGKTKYRLVHWG